MREGVLEWAKRAAVGTIAVWLVGCSGASGVVDPSELLDEPGKLPGSDCRPTHDPRGQCDQDLGVGGAIDLVCKSGTCVIDCAADGTVCELITDVELVCAHAAGDFCARPCYAGDVEALEEDEPAGPLVNGCEEGYACFDEDGVCLPTGGFPGGPCRAADDPEGECDAGVKGIAGADMFCKADLCVVGCAEGGDALCKEVDADLVCNATAGDICVESCLGGGGGLPLYCRDEDMRCFEKDLVCLPLGSFPGGACREPSDPDGECDAGVSDVVGADMRCERDKCVIDCEVGGDALCAEVDEDLRCAEKAGSICAEACLDDGSCRDATFSCFEDDGVCLPAGSFPGGPCREGPDACDHDLDGHADWDMRCEEDVCVVDCEVGGDALCAEVDEELTCADPVGACVRACLPAGTDVDGSPLWTCKEADEACFEDEAACLPVGAFPGSPCRDHQGDECDQDLFGADALDMRCERDTCVVDCEDHGTCAVVDDSLGCAIDAGGFCVRRCGAEYAGAVLGPDGCEMDYYCYEHDGVCLPVGSVPGGPCRAADDVDGACDAGVNDVAGADMRCERDKCVLDCTAGGDALCAEVDEDLACGEKAGDICARRCLPDGGCRDAGYACFEDDGVCLPVGAFPGGPCRAPDDPDGVCDGDVSDVVGADMRCVRDLCVVDCAAGGDALCAEVDEELTCAEKAGDLCAKRCGAGGACEDPDDACFEDDGVCLPRGSFPSSPCREGSNPCDHDLDDDPAKDMVCVDGTCTVDCDAGGDALCADVDEDLVCVESAGVCVRACRADGSCEEADERCFEDEGACLPTGAFPGSECRAEDDADGACDVDLFGVDTLDMRCERGTCVLECADSGTCTVVDEALGCAVDAGGFCVYACAVDDDCEDDEDDFYCYAPDRVCLPVGGVPGGPCRPAVHVDGACDQDVKGVDAADMICERDRCIIDCSAGGDALCAEVDQDLACSSAGDLCARRCLPGGGCRDEGFACFEDGDGADVCLPIGTFPGGPCREADDPDGVCDAAVNDVAGADMRCERDLCVIDCSGAGGDALCAEVDETLTCAEKAGEICAKRCVVDAGGAMFCEDPDDSCFEDDGVCLPTGAFPGSPCRAGDGGDGVGPCDHDVDDNPDADMVCVDGTCTIDCSEGGDTLCADVDEGLTCVETAGVCVRACEPDGSCREADERCFEDEDACLPIGAFPGSECRPADDPEGPCDQDLFEVDALDMRCERDTCVVACEDHGTCLVVDETLGCAIDAGGFCVRTCAGGEACEADFYCYEADLVCLPVGSVPGGPCRAPSDPDGACDAGVNDVVGADMRCEDDTCVIDCLAGGDALCAEVDADLACGEKAGDICARRCLADGGCEDEGFACFEDDGVCLPIGAFPGGPCRAAGDPDGRCDKDVNDIAAADMRCEEDTCVIDCRTGGDALCAQVDEELACAIKAGNFCAKACTAGGGCADADDSCFEDDGVCLPTGAFPGSPCRLGPSPCDHDVDGIAAADMICVEDTCVVDCGAGGDDLCEDVDRSLTCFESLGVCVRGCLAGDVCERSDEACFEDEGACLPLGTFPGSPCRADNDPEGACDQDLFGVETLDMVCVEESADDDAPLGRCAVDCEAGGDGLCYAVDSSLACSEVAGDVCVRACDPGCEAGYSCYPGEETCLPTGSVPGGACRAPTDPDGRCDQDVSGVSGADMLCVDETCVIDCAVGGTGVCAAVRSDLVCSEGAGSICVERCVGGACDDDFACFERDDACLPIGSFPGGPCRSASDPTGQCDQNVGDVDGANMRCIDDLCVIDCRVGGDPLCAEVDTTLACAESAGYLCAEKCVNGACQSGFACFAEDDVCLPTGSFPSSPCRAGASPCDHDLGGDLAVDMICVEGQCVIDCALGGETTCLRASSSLTCFDRLGVCVRACVGDECSDAGESCFEDEGACLPTGSFPGSPCRGASGAEGPCDADLFGVDALDMVCESDTCLVACPGDDDGLCRVVDASLACSVAAGEVCVPSCDGGCDSEFSCFEGEGVCLPTGSFPGSPCRSGSSKCDAVGGVTMVCEPLAGDVCVADCSAGGDAYCAAVSPELACYTPDAADPGYAICLPLGTFPGAPCRGYDADAAFGPIDDASTERCDRGGDADLVCVAGTCAIDCAIGGDALCMLAAASGAPAGMVCASTPSGAVCALPCSEDADCGAGDSCDLEQGACLPYDTLTVLVTAGLSGHVFGTSPAVAYSPDTTGDDPTRGGLARLATVLETARAAAGSRADTTFLVDGGDFTMGTIDALLGGVPERDLLAGLGYDAVALGEHELQWTVSGLILFLDLDVADYPIVPIVPWLAANLIATDVVPVELEARWSPDGADPVATHPLRPWTVIERDGWRVGVFAIVGSDMANRTSAAAPLAFSDAAASASATAAFLRAEEDADLVVMLAHTRALPAPYASELDYVIESAAGIDLVVVGHGDGVPSSKRVGRTLVVSAGVAGEALGEVRVAIGREGFAANGSRWTRHAVDDSVPGAPAWIAIENAYRAAIDQALGAFGLTYDTTLALASFDITRAVGLGDLVTDAMRGAAQQLAPNADAPSHAAIALDLELGDDFLALRDQDGLPAATAVLVADAFAAVPFGIGPDQVPGYPLVDVYLTTSDLRFALEVGATLSELGDSGLALHVAGVVADVRTRLPPFERVVGIYRTDSDGRTPVAPNLLATVPDGTDPASLHRLTCSLAGAHVLAGLGDATGGLVGVTLRGADGVPLSEPELGILDSDPAAEVQELKIALALGQNLIALQQAYGSVPAIYATPSNRMRTCDAPPETCPSLP